jgi:hypothetical protein
MRQDRLDLLADFLRDEVPEDHFDLGTWRYGCENEKALLLHQCGAVACAVGWACTMPRFKEAGLHTNWTGSPVYGGYLGWNAVQAFFGLEQREAYALFSTDNYGEGASPLDVAQRIQLFLKNPDEALDGAEVMYLLNTRDSGVEENSP